MAENAEKGKEMSTPVCVRSDLLEPIVNQLLIIELLIRVIQALVYHLTLVTRVFVRMVTQVTTARLQLTEDFVCN